MSAIRLSVLTHKNGLNARALFIDILSKQNSSPHPLHMLPHDLSYAQKLVTVRLGGVLKLLDPVFELNPLNDFGQSVCAAELSPFLLS